jgi:hypothetical protein
LDNEELICALISEQARSRIADEQLGIAAVRVKHLDWLVPSLVADFQKRHATLHCAGYKATPQTVRTKGLHVEAEIGREVQKRLASAALSGLTLRGKFTLRWSSKQR